ncbi:hypothetical protein B0O99DRAFT_589778 [Bisporella sp. PMI_857]|nr:hypothetical protein B0O99DRAFT_589778 [Bisporella sp. PMI_857]
MLFFKAVTLAFLAAVSTATPITSIAARDGTLEARARDNCTQYTSNSAGSVCIDRPSDCTATYLVQSGDTCQAIGAKFSNFTLSQFYYWNPDIGQTCFGLQAYVPVCINTPWYTFVPPVQAATGTVVDASAVPVPIMGGIVGNCTTYEFVGSGLRVDAIVAQNGITMDEFLEWNQNVDKNTPTVWAEYWVCVGA